MNELSRSPVVGHDLDTCAGGGDAARGPAEWLGLAAAPTFAILALATGAFGGQSDLCVAMRGEASLLSAMPLMYALMSIFHAAPWLRLLSRQPAGTLTQCEIFKPHKR